MTQRFVPVASTAQLPPGGRLVVEAVRREIALFNVEGHVHAIENLCCHRGGPLGEGKLQGRVVTCPWHAWTFDVTTGRCTFNPDICVERFEVRISGDRIEVLV